MIEKWLLRWVIFSRIEFYLNMDLSTWETVFWGGGGGGTKQALLWFLILGYTIVYFVLTVTD